MPGRGLPGHLERVLARAQQLDDGEREIGKAHRDPPARRLRRNASSATASGCAGSRSPNSRASATMRSQRSGVRSTRRSERDSPCSSRKRAATPLAATMKSSISSFARFVSSGARSASVPSREDRPRLERVELERAARLALALQAPARRGPAGAAARRGPATAASAGGARRLAVEPRGDAVVGELGVIAHDRAVDRRSRVTAPSVVDRHLDDDRQPVLVRIERREVGRELLRQHREDLGRGVDRRRVGRARGRRSPSPSSPARRRRRWRRRIVSVAGRAASAATESWSRSRESSLSIDAHSRSRRSRAAGSRAALVQRVRPRP